MNTKTQTTVTDGLQEAGPFESKEAAWSAMLHPFSHVLSIEHRTDGWYTIYIITTTTSTTTLCQDHGIVNPTATRTLTAGWPGPFTEAEAQEYADALLGSDDSIMTTHIVQGEGGWYVGYAYKTTTTLWYSPDTEAKGTLGFRVALAIVAMKNLIKRWRAREWIK